MPFWAQALALCALFAIAGVAVVDDYGASWDENIHRRVAIANADYALGVRKEPPRGTGRYNGVAYEMPLLLAERALGLQDFRHIYLTRHLITHLVFIAGGFVCGLLAYRMIGSRWIALLAMLMFLLHPRLYAHSFFNTRDIPFAVTLLITLYLTRRAFRKDTLGAFLICGICVGLAINLRPFGLTLLPMILAMRGLDLWRAGREERKRILATAGIFAAAATAVAYITHPHYWENPLRFVEGLRVVSQHPNPAGNLFMGEIYRSDAVPWNYIPVWFAITAPPAVLALGAIGCAAVCWQAITHPLATLRDRETRFRILLLGCFAVPVAVSIILAFYNGWRHMYFLWTPFCLLAAVGLHAIANIRMGNIWKVGARLPGWVRGGGSRMAQRALAYGAAGVGLLTTLTAMAALHSYEHLYFNGLTDTNTPGALAKRYDMDYWLLTERQLLEYLLARYPNDALRIWRVAQNRLILPQSDRERVITSNGNPHSADFYVFGNFGNSGKDRLTEESRRFYLHPRVNPLSLPEQPPIYAIHAYGSVIGAIFARDLESYRAAYADIAANGEPLARSSFDIYAYDGALYYLSADCPPPAPDRADLRIFLHITPADLAALPAASREFGFENRDFWLSPRAAFFDGKCIYRHLLPDYPISRIRTGNNVATPGYVEWRVDIDLATHAAAQALYESVASGDYGKPVARSDFDVYLRGNGLAYLKEPCAQGDIDARFFLHIFPAAPADLPVDGRELGFANLDFQFADHGADIGGKCVAERELPGYPIERIRTGQFVGGEGRVWSVEIPVSR